MPANLSKKEKLKTAFALLDKLGLLAYKNYVPEELSGGLQRRIAFLRALAYPAEFFLLDEIFTSLDKSTACQCLEILISEAKSKKIGAICATHIIPFKNDFCEILSLQEQSSSQD